MNDMSIQTTPIQAPQTLTELEAMLNRVGEMLSTIGQDVNVIHQELDALNKAVVKELQDEQEFEAAQASHAHLKLEPYPLTDADYRYVEELGDTWFSADIFNGYFDKSGKAMHCFLTRIRNSGMSEWTVEKRKFNRTNFYRITRKEYPLHDAA